MQNNYFIHNMMERISKGNFTYFLNGKEVNDLKGLLKKYDIKYNILNLYKDSDKVIFYSKKKPKLRVYEIISKKELTHNKILGSLFLYRISPNMYGDIFLKGNEFYIVLMEKVDKNIISLVTDIDNGKVEYKSCNPNILNNFERIYEEVKINVKSLRFDVVLAKLFHKSRNQVDKLFHDKLILLNYNEKIKKELSINENDIFSVRKFGKYKVESIENKKNNFEINLKKYK